MSCKDESGVTAIGGKDDDDDDDDDDNEGDGGADDDADDESASDNADDESASDATVTPGDDAPSSDDPSSENPDEMTDATNGPAPNVGNGGEGTGGSGPGGSGPAPTTPVSPTGAGGDTTSPASSGTGGTPGGGGNPNTGGGPVGVGGTPPASQCAANVVDDFVSCDIDICAHEGRQGTWFFYGGTGIGIDATQAGVRIPPSTWSDQSCAMMLAGGDSLESLDFYAGVGLALNDGLPYSLAGFTGINFTIETGAAVYLTLRNGASEYFIPASASGQTVGVQSFSIPLSSFTARDDNPGAVLNLADIVELQWTVVSPELGFGLAIHSVSLY